MGRRSPDALYRCGRHPAEVAGQTNLRPSLRGGRRVVRPVGVLPSLEIGVDGRDLKLRSRRPLASSLGSGRNMAAGRRSSERRRLGSSYVRASEKCPAGTRP